MNEAARTVQVGTGWKTPGLLALALLVGLPLERAAAQSKPQAKTVFTANEVMAPMDQLGSQSRPFDPRPYAQVIRVGAGEKQQTVAAALASVRDASPGKRYAILVQAGIYREVGLRMKPHVDLYGGFAAGEWKQRDVYQNATILDAQKKGELVVERDLEGFRCQERLLHAAK
jgi:hypothetical protein